MGRAPCCDKANVKKGPWSPEEDAKLKAYIEEYGTGGNWIALPHKIGLKRCGKSCRLRWLNYLRPNIKHGGFSEEEDQIICSLYISIGSRWSIIAAQLPGRTDNDIKNYWNTRLKKKLLGKRRESSQSRCLPPGEATDATNPEVASQGLSASALERLQLHMQLQGLYNPVSFYSNPALWPRFHPLFQSQQTDANSIAATPAQQPDEATGIEPAHQTMLQIKPDMPSSMNANTQEDWDSSTLGFPSPSSTGALSTENSNSNFGSVSARYQAELHALVYGRNNGRFGGQEGHQLAELDCFKEVSGEEESMGWWANSSFEEKSSSGSWDSASALQPDSVLQGYVLGYDL